MYIMREHANVRLLMMTYACRRNMRKMLKPCTSIFICIVRIHHYCNVLIILNIWVLARCIDYFYWFMRAYLDVCVCVHLFKMDQTRSLCCVQISFFWDDFFIYCSIALNLLWCVWFCLCGSMPELLKIYYSSFGCVYVCNRSRGNTSHNLWRHILIQTIFNSQIHNFLFFFLNQMHTICKQNVYFIDDFTLRLICPYKRYVINSR